MFTISQEAEIFLWSFLCGAVIMALYDILSIARRTQGFSILVCNICDGIFVLCSSAVMIFVIFCVSNGYVRAYEFIGAATGGLIYKILLGRYFSLIAEKNLFFLYSFFTKIFKLLLTPIKFMYKIICSIIGLLCRLMRRLFYPVWQKLALHLHTLKKTFKKT